MVFNYCTITLGVCKVFQANLPKKFRKRLFLDVYTKRNENIARGRGDFTLSAHLAVGGVHLARIAVGVEIFFGE